MQPRGTKNEEKKRQKKKAKKKRKRKHKDQAPPVGTGAAEAPAGKNPIEVEEGCNGAQVVPTAFWFNKKVSVRTTALKGRAKWISKGWNKLMHIIHGNTTRADKRGKRGFAHKAAQKIKGEQRSRDRQNDLQCAGDRRQCRLG